MPARSCRCRLRLLAICISGIATFALQRPLSFAGTCRLPLSQGFPSQFCRRPSRHVRGTISRLAAERNPFDVLGLPPRLGLTRDAIKSAYRKLAARVHPDVPGTGDISEFRSVQWAYTELTNPLQRQFWRQQAEVQRPRRRRRRAGTGAGAPGADGEDLEDFCEEWKEYLSTTRERPAEPGEPGRLLLRRLLVKGSYRQVGTHHSRPLYKKVEANDATTPEVFIYFWDERDGPTRQGWWIGPEVGSTNTYAHQSDADAEEPPAEGWRMPSTGPVDKRLRVQSEAAGSFRLKFSASG
mmetsp:Transcript_9587/g.21963  ORF Transcript_9587/g.21963 Transcript_9587/m.21963 type:complete len:296 (-) Transcript_9587:28-915(-)